MIYFFLFIFIIFFIIKTYYKIKTIDSNDKFNNTRYEGFNEPIENNYYQQSCNVFDNSFHLTNDFVPYMDYKCDNPNYEREKIEEKKKKIEFNNCQRKWMVCDI